MQTVPSRLAWRDRFKTSPWNSSPNQPPRFRSSHMQLALNLSLQQFRPNTFPLKRGPRGSFEANNAGKKQFFKFFLRWIFYTREDFRGETHGMACAMSHVVLVSQSSCPVNDHGGKIPAASLLPFLPGKMFTVAKKIFKTFQGQVSINIASNFRSLPSDDHRWSLESREQRGNPIYGFQKFQI